MRWMEPWKLWWWMSFARKTSTRSRDARSGCWHIPNAVHRACITLLTLMGFRVPHYIYSIESTPTVLAHPIHQMANAAVIQPGDGEDKRWQNQSSSDVQRAIPSYLANPYVQYFIHHLAARMEWVNQRAGMGITCNAIVTVVGLMVVLLLAGILMTVGRTHREQQQRLSSLSLDVASLAVVPCTHPAVAVAVKAVTESHFRILCVLCQRPPPPFRHLMMVVVEGNRRWRSSWPQCPRCRMRNWGCEGGAADR